MTEAEKAYQYFVIAVPENEEQAKAYFWARKALRSTLTPQNEWISVEERLPTDERPVLVFVGYADTMTGFITTLSYFCFDANPHWQWDGLVRDEQRTLFWMPLPAPPGKGNNVPTDESLTLEQLRASPHGKIKDSTLQSICNRANEIACRQPEGKEDT